MGANKLQGTPWHTETIRREDGDERRHRSRCKYYLDSTKKCKRRNGRCIGSAHCVEYEEMSEDELKNKRKKKPVGEDDCYWY